MPALQSGLYQLTWEKCADLPSPLYHASVAVHDNKVYTMAGDVPLDDTYDYVYVYDINGNQWDRLPPHGQRQGQLQMINGKLSIIGGVDNATKKITNKVTTYNNNRWSSYYPNLIKSRNRPAAVTHLAYVIVAGGKLDDGTYSNDIELLNYKQSSHWVIARMKLPEPMWVPSLTISNDLLYIVGYGRADVKRTNVAYQVPVDTITSTAQLTGDQTTHWNKLPPAPYYATAIIPYSYPPVIIGGHDIKGVSSSDIRVLDVPNNSWKKIASLTTGRFATAIIPINHDSILVIGGSKGGVGIQRAKAHSISKVEKGSVRLCHTQ